jgi:molybdopterin molybdotransferase
MQEQSAEMNGKVMINEAPPKGAFVRAAGSDFMIGDVVIPAGRRLTPQDVALLGALGLTEVLVLRRIKIAILSTGAELRAGGSALESGQIIDTNGLMLKQLLDRFPATISLPPPLPDSYEKTLEALKQTAVTHDVIITSGGISVGSHDFVRDVVHKIGIIYFWRLAIRPGKPVLFGQIGHCYILCLPGNPVSTMVTFFLIVVPFLQTLCGQETVLPPSFSVPLGAAFRKDARLRHFPRARLEKINNQWKAFPYPDQSSHLIGSLVATDGLLDLPQGLTDFPVDTLVQFRPFSGLFF